MRVGELRGGLWTPLAQTPKPKATGSNPGAPATPGRRSHSSGPDVHLVSEASVPLFREGTAEGVPVVEQSFPNAASSAAGGMAYAVGERSSDMASPQLAVRVATRNRPHRQQA